MPAGIYGFMAGGVFYGFALTNLIRRRATRSAFFFAASKKSRAIRRYLRETGEYCVTRVRWQVLFFCTVKIKTL